MEFFGLIKQFSLSKNICELLEKKKVVQSKVVIDPMATKKLVIV